jgi:hypothetical protein
MSLVHVMIVFVALAWPLATAQGSIVVDVRHFVADLSTVVSLAIGAKSLGINQPFVLHDDTRAAH